jgi:formylglycine-generating enzyme required for sulfatase activity
MLFVGLLAGLASENGAMGPEPGRPWKTSLSADVSLDLAWIPPGTFTLGSPASESGRHSDEGPQTNVTLTKGFWFGKTCVTIGQWKAVMDVGVRAQLVKHIDDETLHDIGGRKQRLRELMNWSPAADPTGYLGNEDDNLPMYFVSWNDAMEFCAKLTARERAAGRVSAGYEYSLPTEAQWEYACRAGSTGATYAGPNTAEVLDRIAWYDRNSAENYTGRPLGPTRSGPRAVGQKAPNAWGLYDMVGNVWQWCRDWHGPYPGGSVTDPTGPATGTLRVNRGGSFGSGANSERSAGRAGNPEFEASAYRGFRIALRQSPQK